MGKKVITFKLTPDEFSKLEAAAKRCGMNNSDYIRACISKEPVTVINKSQQFYASLYRIIYAVDSIQKENINIDLNPIRTEVNAAWHTLNL